MNKTLPNKKETLKSIKQSRISLDTLKCTYTELKQFGETTNCISGIIYCKSTFCFKCFPRSTQGNCPCFCYSSTYLIKRLAQIIKWVEENNKFVSDKLKGEEND